MNIFRNEKLQQVVAELPEDKLLNYFLSFKGYNKVKLDGLKNNSYYYINTLVRCPVSGFSRRALYIINPNSRVKTKLKSLFDKYPKTDKGTMGFPLHWEKEPLWATET